jgi:hypothetical protein
MRVRDALASGAPEREHTRFIDWLDDHLGLACIVLILILGILSYAISVMTP